jgi:hypothetical protein
MLDLESSQVRGGSHSQAPLQDPCRKRTHSPTKTVMISPMSNFHPVAFMSNYKAQEFDPESNAHSTRWQYLQFCRTLADNGIAAPAHSWPAKRLPVMKMNLKILGRG